MADSLIVISVLSSSGTAVVQQWYIVVQQWYIVVQQKVVSDSSDVKSKFFGVCN